MSDLAGPVDGDPIGVDVMADLDALADTGGGTENRMLRDSICGDPHMHPRTSIYAVSNRRRGRPPSSRRSRLRRSS